MPQELLLNQAIATIQGTMTQDGLVVGSGAIKTSFSGSYHNYRERHQLPLSYESSFRVWPRTDRDGQLVSAVVMLPNPSIQGATFSGKVIWVGADRLTIRISPIQQHIQPFLLTLMHDGINQSEVNLRCGWRMQFICEYADAEAKFHIKEMISLKHLLCPKEMISSSAEPENATQAPKELIVV